MDVLHSVRRNNNDNDNNNQGKIIKKLKYMKQGEMQPREQVPSV